MQTHIEQVLRCNENIKTKQFNMVFDMAVSDTGFAFTVNTQNSSVAITDQNEFIAIVDTMVKFLETLSDHEKGQTTE